MLLEFHCRHFGIDAGVIDCRSQADVFLLRRPSCPVLERITGERIVAFPSFDLTQEAVTFRAWHGVSEYRPKSKMTALIRTIGFIKRADAL
jgi:hypothetical protein